MKEASPSGGQAGWPGQSLAFFAGRSRFVVFIVCIYLAGLTWLVFGQTLQFQFVNLDDDKYVSENEMVAKGLSLHGVEWAFTHPTMYLWTPLTTISHMLDCQLFGMKPAGHHLSNVVLHITSVILLFLVLHKMTGALWRSAFVAAVFAIHPLKVESVAWVAERKDVLSGVFFLLTLGAYVYWTRNRPSPARYLCALAVFALGLLAKPMLVTVPLVLLLLDYWPLQRWPREGWRGVERLILEKIPFFVLSALSAAVTFVIGTSPGPVPHPFAAPLRLGNALVSTILYVQEMFYPAGLSVLYPFPPAGQPPWKVATAALLLAAITGGAVLLGKKRPYLLVGWLWYLVTLAPVSGILQTGREAHADRYTYLPQIGLTILITWAVAEWGASWRTHSREVLGGVAAVTLAVLAVCSRAQTATWRDSETMWKRMLACNPGQPLVLPHFNLALALMQKGKLDEAISELKESLENRTDIYRNPDSEAGIRVNMGLALLKKEEFGAAIPEFERVLKVKPASAGVHYNLGYAYLRLGRVEEAIVQFRRAIELKPADAEAHLNLGVAYEQQGRKDAAMAEYQTAVESDPENGAAQYNLGHALLGKENAAEALPHLEKAVEMNPQLLPALDDLAWTLTIAPNRMPVDRVRALNLAAAADEISGGTNPHVLRTLAAAYAANGQYISAAAAARRAMGMLSGAGEDAKLMGALSQELARYETGQAAR